MLSICEKELLFHVSHYNELYDAIYIEKFSNFTN